MTAIAELLLPVNPGILVALAGLLAAVLPATISRTALLLIPVLAGLYLFGVEPGQHGTSKFFGYNLELFRLDALSRLFGAIFLLATLLGNLYAIGDKAGPVQRGAAQVYAGSAIAAVFAGDLVTLFIFFELAAVASVFLIWARGTERSYRAGMRYLVIQITGGVLLLAGILVHVSATGSIAFDHLGTATAGGWLILLAFGVKAAFPFLHGWLADAYPEATISGSVILSAFTTKLAIYALARSYAGTELLVVIGAVMAVFPMFYALAENDLRRVLSYSLNNQLGFMVVGIGIGSELALNGAAAHAFGHILYKALLFMSIGAVLLRTGSCRTSDPIRLFASMPWTAGFCIIGAASISAAPLFVGFISKAMILTAAADAGHWEAWAAMLFASACVLLYCGIKVPYFAFFAGNHGSPVREAPASMLAAMALAAAFCVGIGVYPALLYGLLPYAVEYKPYTTYHVINQLQLLTLAALVFVVAVRMRLYPPALPGMTLDVDWIYRRALARGVPAVGRLIDQGYIRITRGLVDIVTFVIEDTGRYFGAFGRLGGTLRVGNGVAWIAAILLLTLVAAYSTL